VRRLVAGYDCQATFHEYDCHCQDTVHRFCKPNLRVRALLSSSHTPKQSELEQVSNEPMAFDGAHETLPGQTLCDRSGPRLRSAGSLTLCKEGNKIKAYYDATTEDLLFHVLEACQQSLCFCSAPNLARSLGEESLLYITRNTWYTPATEIPQSRGIASISASSRPSCIRRIPQHWKEAKGIYFCLRGRCGGIYGHLLWDHRMYGGAKEPATAFHFLPHNAQHESHMLWKRGAGIEVLPGGADALYTLQFSFDALTAIWWSV
jgi:hypothetical protein